MKTRIAAVMVILFGVAMGSRAQEAAGEYVVSIGDDDVTSYPPVSEGTGKYYTLEFDVPEIGSPSTLETAHVEFYVDAESFVLGDFHWFDADSVEHVGYQAKTPVLEIYALTSAIEDSVNVGQLDLETVVRRPVLVGANRRVLIDIAPIVRTFMAEPPKNHGIVIGSLTGDREGDFTLRDGAFGDGNRARVTLRIASTR
jgi:hypothetical protein